MKKNAPMPLSALYTVGSLPLACDHDRKLKKIQWLQGYCKRNHKQIPNSSAWPHVRFEPELRSWTLMTVFHTRSQLSLRPHHHRLLAWLNFRVLDPILWCSRQNNTVFLELYFNVFQGIYIMYCVIAITRSWSSVLLHMCEHVQCVFLNSGVAM